MRKWTLISLLISFSLLAFPAYAFQVVEGEGYHFVKISSKDVNRIVCPAGPISNVVYSKEKNIQVKTLGRNAYVKIVPKEKVRGGKTVLEYEAFPREIYLTCGGRVFSLVMTPKDVPAETIVLKLPFRDLKKAESFETAASYEDTLLRLVSAAYREDLPDGYELEEVNKEVKRYREASVTLRRRYLGSHYEVREFLVTASAPIKQLSEFQLGEDLVGHPLAVSIVKPALSKGETTRVFVVLERGRDGRD